MKKKIGLGRKDTQVLGFTCSSKDTDCTVGFSPARREKSMEHPQGLWAQEGGPNQGERPPQSLVLIDPPHTSTASSVPRLAWALLCSKVGAMNAMPTAPADPDLPSGALPDSTGLPETPSPSLASDLLFPIAKSTTCDAREQAAQVKSSLTPVFPTDTN